MDNSFSPEKEIPDSFWDLIQSFDQDQTQTIKCLNEKKKQELIHLFKILILAKTELRDVLETYYYSLRPTEAHSEDAFDDLAENIISKGRDSYLRSFHEREMKFAPEDWELRLPLVGIFCDLFYEKFELDIFDEIED